MSTLEIALGYIDRGWSPVPIPYKQKGPLIKDWQNLALNETTAYNHFNGGPQNVGVQLGARSHGLTDVDLDCSSSVIPIANHKSDVWPQEQAGEP